MHRLSLCQDFLVSCCNSKESVIMIDYINLFGNNTRLVTTTPICYRVRQLTKICLKFWNCCQQYNARSFFAKKERIRKLPARTHLI